MNRLRLCILLLALLPAATSDAASPGAAIEVLNVKNMTLRQFAVLMSQGTGARVIVSQAAAELPVGLYLEHVAPMDALEAACRATQCWYKEDPDTGITCIITMEEYKSGLAFRDEERVERVRLHYLDARATGDALQRLFADRVIWERPEEDDDDHMEDLEQALERMDALADRAQFSLSTEGTGGYGGGLGAYGSRYGTSGQYGTTGRYGSRGDYGSRGYGGYGSYGQGGVSELVDPGEVEIDTEALLEQLAQAGAEAEAERVSRPGVVFIAMVKSTNDLLLRTRDEEVMEHMLRVIAEMDQPQPQVLIEVKVLEVLLDDEDARGVDWLFRDDEVSGGRSTGLIGDAGAAGYGTILDPDGNLVPQGTGLNPEAAILQVVSGNVLARLQLLEREGRLVRLATPNLCVADGEASRVFVGSETTILTSIEVEQSSTGGDNPLRFESIDPETDRRNVGTTLLITPRIHSDESVTIRIMQEDSELGAVTDIDYGAEAPFRSQDVKTRSITTTVMAADGQISAVGGLLRRDEGYSDSGVPGLKNVPGVGGLFRTSRRTNTRTELIVLLRPYILRAPGDAEGASLGMFRRISEHPSARDDLPAANAASGPAARLGTDWPYVGNGNAAALAQEARIWETE